MQMRSKLLFAVVAASLFAAPVGGQVFGPYALVRGNFDEAATMRHAAVARCAASIALGSNAAMSKLDIVGYEHPVSGKLRVHGEATFANSPRPVEFSCDVDSRGNLRRLNLASAK
jgi:hypothetical protein